jgi:hypothetical protein
MASLGQYSDVRAVLDAAIAAGGGRYTLKSRGAAIHWRARAYAFRKLLQRLQDEANLIPGIAVNTPYDGMMLTIAKDKDDPKFAHLLEDERDRTVIIHPIRVVGVLTDTDGNVIDVTKQQKKEESVDEFQRAAEELAAKLTL